MEMRNVIEEARQNADSVGGVVELGIVGLPAGVGSPIFDTVEGRLAYGFYGIPAVKGVEFGAGFSAALLKGSENNDEFYISEDGGVKTRTNHHGGVLEEFPPVCLSSPEWRLSRRRPLENLRKVSITERKKRRRWSERTSRSLWRCGPSWLLRRWQLSLSQI